MCINEDYKKIECIDQLSETNKESFFKIVEHYAPKLENNIVVDGYAYTLHDFNHHCVNIYKIISDIIFYAPNVYGNNGLTQKELYILNLAVLFHDIGMHYNIDKKRDAHSRKSSQDINNFYIASDSVFRTKCKLNENEVKALRLIVMAHSDIKGEDIPDNENGLNNPYLEEEMHGQTDKIRARFLASILRLADELDITVARLGNGDVEEQLCRLREEKVELEIKLSNIVDSEEKISIQKRLDDIKGFAESFTHWKRLHLFSSIERKDSESDEINIYINDDYIIRAVDRGDTYEKLADEIIYVYKKINKELKEGLLTKVNESKKKLSLSKLISLAKFELISNIEELNIQIAKGLDYLSISSEVKKEELEIKSPTIKKDVKKIFEEEKFPKVINEQIEHKLVNFVKRKNLLKVGHFLLDETYCARDWLDTKEIIETRAIFEEIIKGIIVHINQNYNADNYLFLGLDLEGAILASRVAMALQRPFSYLIPAKDFVNNTDKDNEITEEKFDKYIIITDAIVTGETIRKVLATLSISDDYEQVLQIYTIFYREPSQNCKERNEALLRKTTCISDNFGVELFKKEDCPYKQEKCFGMNRIIK